jgi:integrase
MTRQLNRLRPKVVENQTHVGRYADGGGLYLQVSLGKDGVTKSWVFRYMRDGRARQMGLGAVSLDRRDGLVTLAMARDKAFEARRALSLGQDPLALKIAKRTALKIEEAKSITFKDCAEKYIETHEASWRNSKHRHQWKTTLETYAFPLIGSLPVSAVDTDLVYRILDPIWKTRTETASRLRGRIESVLDWATVRKFRSGENPARWRGHLENLLPNKSKTARVKHHEAMPYADLPAFMADLRKKVGISAMALEFTVLTAARSGEVIGARWEEIDLAKGFWVVPAARMKAGVEHRVPLSSRSIAILKKLDRKSEWVFPGTAGLPLSNMAMLKMLRGMTTAKKLTVHGMRSAFMDWGHEMTAYPKEMMDIALAHKVSDKVEAAYRRGDMFEKRRRLMADWDAYCSSPPVARDGNVVSIRMAGAEA